MWNSPWIRGSSVMIPIYSGEHGCLRHWISWNRGMSHMKEYQLSLPPPPSSESQGDNAIDITPVVE